MGIRERSLHLLSSHRILPEDGVTAGLEASFLDEEEGFLHIDIMAFFSCLVDEHGRGGIQLAGGKVDVFLHVRVAVDEAGEKFAFGKSMHEAPPDHR